MGTMPEPVLTTAIVVAVIAAVALTITAVPETGTAAERPRSPRTSSRR